MVAPLLGGNGLTHGQLSLPLWGLQASAEMQAEAFAASLILLGVQARIDPYEPVRKWDLLRQDSTGRWVSFLQGEWPISDRALLEVCSDRAVLAVFDEIRAFYLSGRKGPYSFAFSAVWQDEFSLS